MASLLPLRQRWGHRTYEGNLTQHTTNVASYTAGFKGVSVCVGGPID